MLTNEPYCEVLPIFETQPPCLVVETSG